jgi:predicted DCC family thiol-disulfide oxidoreductase YuxK
MPYHVVYDDQCNLCSAGVDILKSLDWQGQFDYIPMSDTDALHRFDIIPASCELGMYLIDAQQPERKWQGSEAVEEITRLLPAGDLFISLYRAIPGAKSLGDRAYEQIRDHRYEWFGRRS